MNKGNQEVLELEIHLLEPNPLQPRGLIPPETLLPYI